MSKTLKLPQPRFSGHETFVCRYAWLPKVVEEIGHKHNHALFKDENDAMVRLGVGKNMVRSIRYWAESAQLIVSTSNGYDLTPFGQRLFGHDGLDPYMEVPETLWLLHWKIATNPLHPSHYWTQMLNYWHRSNFSASVAIPFLEEALPNGAKCSERTISDGFRVFVNTYIPTRGRKGVVAEDNLDSPFNELGLIRETKALPESLYSFNLEDKPAVTAALFAYCLNDMWNNHHPDADHLTFSAISTGEGSPGQIFKLPELAVRSRLEQMESVTKGDINYVESASLQQVIRQSSDSLVIDLLDAIYIDR